MNCLHKCVVLLLNPVYGIWYSFFFSFLLFIGILTEDNVISNRFCCCLWIKAPIG